LLGEIQLISIIGAGRVGTIAALNMLRMHIADITLIDIVDKLAEGEAMDMIQASPILQFDGKIKGSTNFEDLKGSELVIIIAGSARKPGTSRLDLTRTNAKIISSIVEKIVKYAPECKIMMVTNPVDIMTYIAFKKSGFEKNRVFGMGGLLDSLRYRSLIANEVGISREDVNGFVIGEHGDHMIPLTDFTSISGIPIEYMMKKDRIEKIVEKTKTGGMDVISRKGSTVYGPSSAIAFMVESILKGKNRIVSASVIPHGEYGLKDVAIGLPIILGKNGIERIIELNFDEEIRKRLLDAASIIKSSISDVKDYF